MRKAPALLAVAALVIAALSGCSNIDRLPGGDTDTAASLVTANSDFGVKPTVTFPTPLKTDKTVRTDLIEGSGTTLQAGQMTALDYSVYNGSTGKVLEQTPYDGKTLATLTLNDKTIPGLSKGLQGEKVGSRVVVVIPPKDAFGNAGNANVGVGASDTLVFVVDIRKAYLLRANGTPQVPEPGFPTVVLAPNGQPGVTIPKTSAPKKLMIETLKQGHGKTVGKKDTVIVHYTGVLWKERTVFDSSWDSGQPASFDLSKGVISGFADALVGKKVGSQIVVVIPPDKAYGAKGNGQIPANATLVFVADIVGIA